MKYPSTNVDIYFWRFFLVVASALLSSCATGSVVNIEGQSIHYEPGDRIALVGYTSSATPGFPLRLFNYYFYNELSSKIDQKQLQRIDINHFEDIHNNDQIGKSFLEEGPIDIPSIMEHPLIVEKILPFGFQYLILTNISIYRVKKTDGVECGAAMGGVGCGGLDVWENQTSMKAIIIDIEEQKLVGIQEAIYDSTSWALWLGIPVAGAFDSSASYACRELGKSVAGVFVAVDE